MTNTLLQHSARLATTIVVILALVFISLRGYTFWQDYKEIEKPVSVKSIQPESRSAERPISFLVNLHLFGQPATVAEKAPEPETKKLPETKLKLTLRGVSAGDENSVGSALVEGPDKKTDFFRVGTKLPGNAELHSVYANRIVIDRKGKLENLFFPEKWDESARILSIQPEEDEDEEVIMRTSQFEDNMRESSRQKATNRPKQQDPSLSLDEISDTRREEIKNRLQKLREQIRRQRGE